MDGLSGSPAGQGKANTSAEQTSRRPSLLPAFEPTLLPAFEPFSSSPGGLPRTLKRKFDDALQERKSYPTPIPTSSTGVLPSSPPRGRSTRPAFERSVSTLSERAPLSDVPALVLPDNGEPIIMGRSSNSSDYRLPSNRQISRTHVRAQYFMPVVGYPEGKVEVECLGWNGVKVHCRGEIRELAKGEMFVSDKRMLQIIVDVYGTRVMLLWPKEDGQEPAFRDSGSPWALESPSKKRATSIQHFPSSPPAMLPRAPASPVSPTPNPGFGATFASTFQDGPVQVYEDRSSDEDAPHDPVDTPKCPGSTTPTPALLVTKKSLHQSHSTVASDPEELSEHDEENDPIVHSFYGENIMSRFESIKSASPERKRKKMKTPHKSPPQKSSAFTSAGSTSPIKNHVINQLAFSRIHSLPLSTIHTALPVELRGAMTEPSDTENRHVLTVAELKEILDDLPCVGEISRAGKDAAGKLLESEFYYVPEMDTNVERRDLVTQSLGKTSIRAARKQHKQYYWKPPRY